VQPSEFVKPAFVRPGRLGLREGGRVGAPTLVGKLVALLLLPLTMSH